jgi:transcription elongation GreA/GreB family factor
VIRYKSGADFCFFCKMLNVKQELLARCFDWIDERIQAAESAINAAREASQDDTKSSAGDKYETTREMMQQEISRGEAQLFEARKLKHTLSQVIVDKTSDKVQNGSLVICNQGNFFIAISAGLIKIDGKNYYAISSASPIGRLMMTLGKGDRFAFQGKTYEIGDIA